MEENISLQDLFKTVRKRLVLIMSIVICAVAIAGIASYNYLTPIYEATTQILINQQKNEQNQFVSPDIQTNLQLINTYNVIIKSPAILSKVIEEMELKTTPAELETKIMVNSAQNSQVVNVSIQNIDPRKAVEIANTIAEVFQEEIQILMNIDNVNILSPATHIKKPLPIKPNPIFNMAIAMVIGTMLGVGITFLLDYLDTTIKTEQNIEDVLQLPILGHVSPILSEKIKKTKKPSIEKRKGRLMNV